MATTQHLQPVMPTRLDRILECAVVLSWKELMPVGKAGLIHIEYHAGPERSLEDLKVWLCTVRGHWNLVCDYWMHSNPSHGTGLTFSDGYYSGDLARMLDEIMQHQDRFANFSQPSSAGTIQIQPPAEEESVAARTCMAASFAQAGTSPTEQLVAAWTNRRTR